MLTWIIAVCIPDVPSHVKLMMLREQRLVSEAKYEQAMSLSGSVLQNEDTLEQSYPKLVEMGATGRRTSTLSGLSRLSNTSRRSSSQIQDGY